MGQIATLEMDATGTQAPRGERLPGGENVSVSRVEAGRWTLGQGARGEAGEPGANGGGGGGGSTTTPIPMVALAVAVGAVVAVVAPGTVADMVGAASLFFLWTRRALVQVESPSARGWRARRRRWSWRFGGVGGWWIGGAEREWDSCGGLGDPAAGVAEMAGAAETAVSVRAVTVGPPMGSTAPRAW